MEESDFIPTKGSSLKRKAVTDFKVITYESYKPKGKRKKDEEEQEDHNFDNRPQLNIKKTKHEIFKFGMSGLDAKRKEEAKIQLAIKLGAKPPKNEYKNYKKLQLERKKEREVQKNELEFNQLGKNKLGKSTAKGKSFDRKRKIAKKNILDIYGKIKPSIAKKELNKMKHKK